MEWSDSKGPVQLRHYLIVQVPPKVHALNVGRGGVLDATENEDVTLQCRADGVPNPKIQWVSELS